MLGDMTVAEMSPIELYSVIMTALVMFGLALLAVREYQRKSIDTIPHKVIFFGGLFALCGLPVVISLSTLLVPS